MRAWELDCGIRIAISNEEQNLCEKLLDDANSVLNEREKIVAHRLVSKSVLHFDGNQYTLNSMNAARD